MMILDTSPYVDAPNQEPDLIGVSGTMRYLKDIGVGLEDISVLAIGEALQSPTMGELTREGFVAGWKAFKSVAVAPLLRPG